MEGRVANSSLGMKGVNKYVETFTDFMFKAGGGDPASGSKARYNEDGSVMTDREGNVVDVKDRFDINPSKVEYVFEYFLGGRGTFWNNMLKTSTGIIEGSYSAIAGKEKFSEAFNDMSMNEAPVIRRLVRQPWGDGVVGEYYRIADEMTAYEQAKRDRKGSRGEDFESPGDRKSEIALEMYQDYKKDLDDLWSDMNDTDDQQAIEMMKQQREMLMKRFTEQFHALHAQNDKP